MLQNSLAVELGELIGVPSISERLWLRAIESFKKIHTSENPTNMFMKYVPIDKFELCLDLINITWH